MFRKGERKREKEKERITWKKKKGKKKGRESHSRLRPKILKIFTNANFFFINVQNRSSLYTITRFHFWETVLKEIN